MVTVASARTDFYVYIPATGRWVPRGTLYNFRRNHRAVLLEGGPEQCADNCGKVLLIGGLGADGMERSAELLSLNATDGGSSVPTPALTASRPSGHSATLLPTGQVVVAGGDGAANSAEFFDPKAAVTEPGAPTPRYRVRAVAGATPHPASRRQAAARRRRRDRCCGALRPVRRAICLHRAGPARLQKALLLPPWPLSLCATNELWQGGADRRKRGGCVVRLALHAPARADAARLLGRAGRGRHPGDDRGPRPGQRHERALRRAGGHEHRAARPAGRRPPADSES